MRKLVFGINITLDGCCDHTKGMADGEIHDYFTNLMKQSDTIVYGRKTYELMVPFWPDIAKNNTGDKSMDDFANAFDAVEKIIVFSRTLTNVNHPKTTIVNNGLKEEILKLKQQEGKDISIGGVDLPSQLVELDLIDEYHFVVQPLIVGAGRRLFDALGLAQKLQLKLAEKKAFKSGAVALHYVK